MECMCPICNHSPAQTLRLKVCLGHCGQCCNQPGSAGISLTHSSPLTWAQERAAKMFTENLHYLLISFSMSFRNPLINSAVKPLNHVIVLFLKKPSHFSYNGYTYKGYLLLHPSQPLLAFLLFTALLTGRKWSLIVALIFFSLISDVHHSYTDLLAICRTSYEKCLSRYFPHFKFSYLFSYYWVVYKTVSHFVVYLFTVLTVSSAVEKLFILSWSHLCEWILQ